MEAVGATEAPNTLEEMEELLIKFRNEDPDGNGEKDTYALGTFFERKRLLFHKPICFLPPME